MTRAEKTGPISLLVTDLDNTLYDWIGFFVPAFYAMAEAAAERLDIDIDLLLNDLRAVHQRHGSAEHPFALLETDVVQSVLKDVSFLERRAHFDEAFHRFNSVRKHTLQLYEGVAETLKFITETGVPVVAYTDARIPNSLFRIKRLGLEAYIRFLYAPDQKFPGEIWPGDSNTDLLRVLPPDDKKPNPKTLLDICRNLGVDPAHTLYVGDSLSRDIFMAESAGVRSALARYGTHSDPSDWQRLVRVTHWTADDLAREERLRIEASSTTPDVVLDSFSDLLAAFDFEQTCLPDRTLRAN